MCVIGNVCNLTVAQYVAPGYPIFRQRLPSLVSNCSLELVNKGLELSPSFELDRIVFILTRWFFLDVPTTLIPMILMLSSTAVERERNNRMVIMEASQTVALTYVQSLVMPE